MKKIFGYLVIWLFASTANAGLIEFVPPNDTTGKVFSTNGNDGWSGGRGVVFQMLDNITIDSVGVFQDLTNINLSFELAQVSSASGNVTSGQTILASGSGVITTSGLEWVAFGISDLLLTAGNYNFRIQMLFYLPGAFSYCYIIVLQKILLSISQERGQCLQN